MKYSHNINFFSKPNLLNSYWAGFIAADGCLSVKKNNSYVLKIKLAPKDRHHLEKFKKSILYTGTIKEYKDSWCNDILYPNLIICGAQKLIFDLGNNFNIFPKKTFNLNPPSSFKNESNKLSYIIGYIDGDGCIFKDRGLDGLHILGTENLLEWIKNIFDKEISVPKKKNPKVRKCKNKNVFEYKVVGKRATEILKSLNRIKVPKLKRKWHMKEELNNEKD